MADESEIKAVCSQLVQVVEVMTDPSVPNSQRIEAYHKFDEFRQNSPITVQCGLLLSGNDYPQAVRRFGLKLLEDSIKLRWNEMNPGQKLFIKESVMGLIGTGNNSMQEASFIKDGISRLCVEIIKREWPQQWPSLLAELDGLCQRGEAQTEMVMLVMLRLVEDVVVLQTLENQQRRKEIYQALTANVEEIFKFLLLLLEKHYKNYLVVKNAQPINQHGRVCQAVLGTFSVFVDWVPITLIMASNKYLIRCLCVLLSDGYLQMQAAECLLNIVNWRAGKIQDRMQILSLFGSDMMAPLFEATEQANQKALEESHYHFLKRMVEIFAKLGGQVADIWIENKTNRPENFDMYMNALLAFSQHASHSVNHIVTEVWNKFLRHPGISKDDIFRSFIPKWVECVIKKTVKQGYPTESNHPSCSYSLLDFDNGEEFSAFFGKYRILILEGIRLISLETPSIPYQVAEVWLKHVLTNAVNIGPKGNNGMCTVDSLTYLELDALAYVLDTLFSKATLEQVNLVPSAAALVKMSLDYQTNDAVLMCALLSCISAMFPVVNAQRDFLLMPTMTKLFTCITSATGPNEVGVQMLRRHGCALMVKIASRHGKSLLPLFDHLKVTIVEMRKNEQILPSQFATLVEALILISNEMKNYELQTSLILGISEHVVPMIMGLESAIQSPASFIQFVGLNQPPAPQDSDPHRSNRSNIKFCLNFILAICGKAAFPTNIDDCRKGGFVISENGSSFVLRNPSWPLAQSVIRVVFMIAKTLNGLWASTSLIHPGYGKVLAMLENEKLSVSGMRTKDLHNAAPVTPMIKMQKFIMGLFEGTNMLLSQLCTSCGHDFYQLPQLSHGLLSTVLNGLEHIPDYRLRAVNKFMKNLIVKCPKHFYLTVLAPVLQAYCPFMLNRLSERWKHLSAVRESPSFDENNIESEEVTDDVICRHLAREYLDLVKSVLTSGNGSDVTINANSGEVKNVEEKIQANGNSTSISELGNFALHHESLGQCLITTILKSLVWPDSPSSVRASVLLELLLPTLVQGGQLQPADASQIMVAILSAIHELGQHEANYITLIQLAVQAYELMRTKYPGIVDILAQVPGCNQEDLLKFDKRMVSLANGKENTKVGDKAKKDMFKKVVGQFIGKDVAQMFKQEVVIKNLPTIQLLKPAKQKGPDGSEDLLASNVVVNSLPPNHGKTF